MYIFKDIEYAAFQTVTSDVNICGFTHRNGEFGVEPNNGIFLYSIARSNIRQAYLDRLAQNLCFIIIIIIIIIIYLTQGHSFEI